MAIRSWPSYVKPFKEGRGWPGIVKDLKPQAFKTRLWTHMGGRISLWSSQHFIKHARYQALQNRIQ